MSWLGLATPEAVQSGVDAVATPPVKPDGLGGSNTTFRGGRPARPGDVYIAVMGVTGSGKSSFITACSGKSAQVGHDLKACTATVDAYAYEMDNDRTVYLIDTPGFDDTNKSDSEVLREIAAWLSESYLNQILLNGIIYLHRITDIRMQGSAKKNLLLFKQLCGKDALDKVILVTSMWDQVSSEEGARREQQLVDTPEFWGWMISKGSSCKRHNNSANSAKEIVNTLAYHNKPIATHLQRQLVDENLTLDQTAAGRELESEMRLAKEKWAQERREIEEQLKEAMLQRDREVEEALREERDKYTQMIKKVESETDALRSNVETLLTERNERLAAMQQKMQEQQDELARLESSNARRNQKMTPRRTSGAPDSARSSPRSKKDESLRAIATTVATDKKGNVATDAYEKAAVLLRSYSLTLKGNFYCLVGSDKFFSNSDKLDQIDSTGRARLRRVSIGDTLDNSDGFPWVAQHRDQTWSKSEHLEREYPKLDKLMREEGTKNLEVCNLGPPPYFHARYAKEEHRSNLTTEQVDSWTSCVKDGGRILNVVFGYANSYVITYLRKDMSRPSLRWNLKGHYGRLEPLLSERYPQNGYIIISLALNLKNPDDYLVIVESPNGRHTLDMPTGLPRGDALRWWWQRESDRRKSSADVDSLPRRARSKTRRRQTRNTYE